MSPSSDFIFLDCHCWMDFCVLKVACLARCNGAKVTMHAFGTFKLTTFRELVKCSCKSVEQHVIVAYSRKAFSQTGDGHFSPIGGYHEKSDHALILDTVAHTPHLTKPTIPCRPDSSIHLIGCPYPCSTQPWRELIPFPINNVDFS